jgi:two-component system, NarL family, invasion response regulator UvrY
MNESFQTKQPAPIYIAYAEDHSFVRTSVIDYLHRLGGIEIMIEAGNGRELIERIAASDQLPDVCLIDIVMPKMNGFEAVATIKKKWGDMKLLVLSGYLTEEYVIRMILSGADGYLTKNADPLAIKQSILDLHQTGWCNSELFTPKFLKSVRSGKYDLPHLTGKEIELLKLSIEDKTYEEIAVLMESTPKSIEGHRSRLYAKLEVKTRAGLAMYAVRYGYVAIGSGVSPL